MPMKPQPSYGPGAEARMRQEEGQRTPMRPEIQESEMRLRLMEQEKIRQRQQASFQAQQQLRLRDDRARQSPYGSPKPPSALSGYISQSLKQPSPVPPPVSAGKSAASNPFDDDDDITGYDSSKDPFAADEPTPKKQLAAKVDAGNPFNEYDSNLDPFAE